jgi:small subunit ribosomal protein S1
MPEQTSDLQSSVLPAQADTADATATKPTPDAAPPAEVAAPPAEVTAPAAAAPAAAVDEEVEDDDGPAPGNELVPPTPPAALTVPGGAPPDQRKSRPRNPRLRAIEEAFKNETPVEGLVKSTNKGGLEIDLAGIRAFCPLSQIELRFCHDPSPYVGQRLRFKVIKFDGARNIVLSRKSILAEENAAKSHVTQERLSAGHVMQGRVTSLVDYGAFVDLGGVTGLIHISELAHGRVAHPRDVLNVGQEIEVMVLQVEQAEGRREPKVSLSLKAISEDPWSRAASLEAGSKVRGKVMRLKSFGAFVELWPGVDGLIHNTNLADPPPAEPGEVVQPGQEVEATVVVVDVEKKRIGLSLVGMRDPSTHVDGPQGEPRPRGPRPGREGRGPRSSAGLEVGQILQTKVEKVEQFGVFVRLPSGGRGLIPNAEMGTPRGTDHKKQFPEGTEIKAQIIEIGERGRIRLSKKGAENAEERAAYSGYMAEQKANATLGTLADLLRAKADERKH